MDYHHITHPFPPVFDGNCKILILGSLPSVKSRENNFYYGHIQNRFWKLLAALFAEPVPEEILEKKALLLRHHIALWDVIASCDIRGSSDSSIRNVEPTQLRLVLDAAPIERIYANGTKAAQLYRKYQQSVTRMPITALPSTSPANAAWTLEKLCQAWRVIQSESV